MGRLSGKVAAITGAGAGFGRAAALLFAREGAQVVVADVNERTGQETVEEIRGAGGEALFVQADVSKAADVQRLVMTTVATYGRLNVQVNNAGVWFPHTVEELTEAQWDRLIGVHLKGVWLGCKYAIPEMRKIGGGSIVNTSSGGGIIGSRAAPAYSAAKGGVVIFTKAVALALAKENIRVNSICPGPAESNLYDDNITLEAFRQRAVPAVPLGRLGLPEEIAYGMLFLASDESSFMTGAELIIDGGMTAQ